MHDNLVNHDVRAIESLMATGATIVEKLNALFKTEAPVKTSAIVSDCCESNNYKQALRT